MYGAAIALLSGAMMSVQGVWNTDVTKQTSLWVSAAFVQFSALLTCLGAWWLNDRTSFRRLWEVSDKYVLLGGVIGAFITATVIRSISALGPAKSSMLIVLAQLSVSWLIELLGLFGTEKEAFSVKKLLGLLIAAVGVILFEMTGASK